MLGDLLRRLFRHGDGYETVPTVTQVEQAATAPTTSPSSASGKSSHWFWLVGIAGGIFFGVWFLFGNLAFTLLHPIETNDPLSVTQNLLLDPSAPAPKLAVPHGVNLGSWLSLEDYFFVGDQGAVEVATPNPTPNDPHFAAHCLPPLLTNTSWHSETDLFDDTVGTQEDRLDGIRKAIQSFHAFRTSYVDFQKDLPRIASLGIRQVRVPISWCWTSYDPTNDPLVWEPVNTMEDTVQMQELLLERYTCLDPYYDLEDVSVRWPAVPQALVRRLLKACAKNGLQAILDIHTYPGGTSLGTFSGVWPRPPLFWKYDRPEDPKKDVGRQVFASILTFLENLRHSDADAFQGLGGITPMNEPGHLAGLFGPGSSNPETPSFVPSLPPEMEKTYVEQLTNSDRPEFAAIPEGPHLRVLRWQSDAVQAFRETSLPSHGVQLVVNLHESILVPALTKGDDRDPGGRHPHATRLLASWWRQVTTNEERQRWAVLDMHHYHAWEATCQGTVSGRNGQYRCSNVAASHAAIEQCSSWATVYRSIVAEQLGPGGLSALLVSGEFSASTHHSVLESCRDPATVLRSYLSQVQAADQSNVKLFFWSWKMPYGGAFRSAWSFVQLLRTARQEDSEDDVDASGSCMS